MSGIEFKEILYSVQDGVATIAMHRPTQRNAQSEAMLDEIDAALNAADHDDVKVVILRGIGEHFSAGHDLKEAQLNRADFTVEERWHYEERKYLNYALRIWQFPKPTIAEVQGACIAAGFVIANMCDLILASEDAFFADKVTTAMGAATTEVLVHPWVMSNRRAKELLFTGQSISAQEAYRIGMINRICPRETLEAQTRELALQIAKGPGFALSLTKRSLNQAQCAQGFTSTINAHFVTHQLSHVSEEYKRVREAGLDKVIKVKTDR